MSAETRGGATRARKTRNGAHLCRSFGCGRASATGSRGTPPRDATPGRYTNLMPPRSTQTINVDGVALEVAIERKGVKNVNARLTGSTLSVSAPHTMPQEALDEAVLKLARRLLRRAHASRVNEEDDALK